MLSIIIPVLNEETSLKENADCYAVLSRSAEIIFVDGGSTDDSVKLAKKMGRVIHGKRNRASQMNLGAGEAGHDILLFLHADTVLHPYHLVKIVKSITEDRYIGGCFRQTLDDPALIYRWIAFTGNMRAIATKIFYGDQAIFVRRDVFKKLGGFPGTGIGEDVIFTKRLRTMGKVVVLPHSVRCSVRRWKELGIPRTLLLNFRINTALMWNQDLEQLAESYHDYRD